MKNAILVYNPDIAIKLKSILSDDNLFVLAEESSFMGRSFDNIIIPYPINIGYLKFLSTKLKPGGKFIYLYPQYMDVDK